VPRFFFHFKTPDDYFEDDIGSDLDDLAAVHSAAARLVSCVIRWTPLANSPPDFRHWIVTVTDERRQSVLSMIFPLNDVPKNCKPTTTNDARALLLALDGKVRSGELPVF
jgi:hypothetical protein